MTAMWIWQDVVRHRSISFFAYRFIFKVSNGFLLTYRIGLETETETHGEEWSWLHLTHFFETEELLTQNLLGTVNNEPFADESAIDIKIPMSASKETQDNMLSTHLTSLIGHGLDPLEAAFETSIIVTAIESKNSEMIEQLREQVVREAEGIAGSIGEKYKETPFVISKVEKVFKKRLETFEEIWGEQ